MTPKLTESCRFSLRLLSEGERTSSEIAILAQDAGLNRRHDDPASWAEFHLSKLCDVGLVEASRYFGVYRITAFGRQVSGR